MGNKMKENRELNAKLQVANKMLNHEDLNKIDNKRKRSLALISQLLCALYNMKKNSVKNNEPLKETELKDLLNSEIDIDEEGRPKAKAIVRPTYFVHERRSSIYNMGLLNHAESMHQKGRITRLGNHLKLNKLDKQRINQNVRTDFYDESNKVSNWDDLLNLDVSTGQINPPASPVKNIRPISKDDIIFDNVKNITKTAKPIWLRSDRHGFDLEKQYLPSSGSDNDLTVLLNNQEKSEKSIENLEAGNSNTDVKLENKH